MRIECSLRQLCKAEVTVDNGESRYVSLKNALALIRTLKSPASLLKYSISSNNQVDL